MFYINTDQVFISFLTNKFCWLWLPMCARFVCAKLKQFVTKTELFPSTLIARLFCSVIFFFFETKFNHKMRWENIFQTYQIGSNIKHSTDNVNLTGRKQQIYYLCNRGAKLINWKFMKFHLQNVNQQSMMA